MCHVEGLNLGFHVTMMLQCNSFAEAVVKSCGGDKEGLAIEFEDAVKKQLSNYETSIRLATKRAVESKQRANKGIENVEEVRQISSSEVSALASMLNATAESAEDS